MAVPPTAAFRWRLLREQVWSSAAPTAGQVCTAYCGPSDAPTARQECPPDAYCEGWLGGAAYCDVLLRLLRRWSLWCSRRLAAAVTRGGDSAAARDDGGEAAQLRSGAATTSGGGGMQRG